MKVKSINSRPTWTRGWLRAVLKKPLHCVFVSLLFTSVLLSLYKRQQYDSAPATSSYSSDSNLASSGTIFKGDVIRKFPHSKLQYNRGGLKLAERPPRGNVTSCRKWGVLTTIFAPPSEAIRRFSYLEEWCLVIVGDRKLKEEVTFYIKHTPQL